GQTSLQIIRLVTERVSIDPVLLDLTSEGDLYLRSRLEHVTVDSYSRFPQGSKQMSTGVVTGPFVQFNLIYEKAVPINGSGYNPPPFHGYYGWLEYVAELADGVS